MAEPLLRLKAIGIGISVAVTAPIKKAAGEVRSPEEVFGVDWALVIGHSFAGEIEIDPPSNHK